MLSFRNALQFLSPGGILFLSFVMAVPRSNKVEWDNREEHNATNMVAVNGADNYCLIVPKDPRTDIGDSEYPGGTMTYCTSSGRSSDKQGTIPSMFWTHVEFQTGARSGAYVQLTGCIDPSTVDRLNPDDSGGQYDSSGGVGSAGNPAGSTCAGYNHYVQLIEPAGPRACIRCCVDSADCPTHQDKMGCPNVIPGNYFDCA